VARRVLANHLRGERRLDVAVTVQVVLGVVLLIAFIAHALRTSGKPINDLRLFSDTSPQWSASPPPARLAVAKYLAWKSARAGEQGDEGTGAVPSRPGDGGRLAVVSDGRFSSAGGR
jgi:hypothetical protein